MLTDDPAVMSHQLSHSNFNSPSLRPAPQLSPPPPLPFFDDRSHSPPVNPALSLQQPSVAHFADLQFPPHIHSHIHSYQPPQPSNQQRSVSPSSNNNRVTHNVTRTICHTSSPPRPTPVTSRVNKTQRKKRQSSSRASRTTAKSMPQLVVHPSRTQQPLQPQPQPPHPPHPTHIPSPLSKSPPPHLSNLPQIPSSTTPTTAATPSTTNSVQRSPPRTPYPIVSSKPLSIVPHQQQQPNSTIQPLPNNSSHPNLSAQLSSHTVLTNSPSNHSKSQYNTGSTSTRHAASHSAKPARTTKPRDKLSRVTKLIKCRTKEQLVDQMLRLLRASEISEDLVRGTLAPIDISHYVSQCRLQYDLVYKLLSERRNPPSSAYDSLAYNRCKPALLSFKNLVSDFGRMFIEAAVWMDVLRFCLLAAQMNAQLPEWREHQYNKTKLQLHTKLEQFATRAVNYLAKMKQSPLVDAHDATELVEMYQRLLPSVATKLNNVLAILRPVNVSVLQGQKQSSERPTNTDSSVV
eukprot:gb/GEZJ01001920.1/.p1 GENE.gb/GEZJ01001920.1/~~gb/GEZJ01001920.1/.p1  ORF type:complete len:601 (+),score=90.82 gb/GEZJ01001920.1/:254-1804(+)